MKESNGYITQFCLTSWYYTEKEKEWLFAEENLDMGSCGSHDSRQLGWLTLF
jgi:hypothetical protein